MVKISIVHQPLAALKLAKRNARTHSAKQIAQIAESLKKFGWTNPILVRDDGQIVAGHGRFEAAKKLAMTEVPTIRLSQLTPEECRLYAIADNRLAEMAGWDRDLLALELGELITMNLDLDIELSGFATGEIDILLESNTSADDEGEIAEPDRQQQATSQPGDVWVLGTHKIICANALEEGSYRDLLGDQVADIVVCDPPYNVRINGHVSGLGKVQHREFEMAAGEMSEAEFADFLEKNFRLLGQHTRDGALSFQFIDWRHVYEMLTAARRVNWDLKNMCVWVKENGGMGSLYRSRHELVCVFKNGASPHVNNVELGRFGRNRTNVWEYRGMSSIGRDRDESLALHPTVKPVALVADAIQDCSKRNDLVLDSFLGSGTTLIAAEKTGRRCFGIEIDPHYVDVAISRWQKLAKLQAVLESSGSTFGDVHLARVPATAASEA